VKTTHCCITAVLFCICLLPRFSLASTELLHIRALEQNTGLLGEPSFPTFAVSTEMEMGKAWPILAEAAKGLYVSVGSERSFRGAAMANATGIVVVDISPKVLRFAKINRELLKAATLQTYRHLRFHASLSEWTAFGLSEGDYWWWHDKVRFDAYEAVNQDGTDVNRAIFLRIASKFETLCQQAARLGLPEPSMRQLFETYSWKKIEELAQAADVDLSFSERELERWRRAALLNRHYQDWQNYPSESFDFGRFVDSRRGSYLHDCELYHRLHLLAISGRIAVVFADLGDEARMGQLVQAIGDDQQSIGVLDLDNAYVPVYLWPKSYLTAVNQLMQAGKNDSLLLAMVGWKWIGFPRIETHDYLGFSFEKLKEWGTWLWWQVYARTRWKLFTSAHK
jgi:hypothetical protein